MNKQDLRIGILMYDSVRQKEVTLELKHFKELEIAETNFFQRYKPIQLTPEWLLRFGFNHYGGTAKSWFMDWELMHGINRKISIEGDVNFLVWIEGKSMFSDKDNLLSTVWINTVHELQNLILSLTKTELKLKP